MKKIVISSEECHWNFRQDVTYDDIKSHKKTGIHPVYQRYTFGKTAEEGGGR